MVPIGVLVSSTRIARWRHSFHSSEFDVKQNFFQQCAALNLRADIAVIGYQQVAFQHRETDAGSYRLLAFAGGIGSHQSGTLQVNRGTVEYPSDHHILVEVD